MRGTSCLFAPIRNHAFFEKSVLQGRVGNQFLHVAHLPTQILHLIGTGLTRRVAGKPLLARFQKFLRPAVIKALGNLTPALSLPK